MPKFLAFCLLLLLGGIVPGASQPDGAPAAAQRPVVFESDRDGDYELYAINARGGDVIQLTDNDYGDGSPAWSRDGRLIAFSALLRGDWNLHALSEAGDRWFLTDAPGEDDKAAWSPDGRRIAFSSRREGANWADLYVINADGQHVRNLTRHIDDDREPAWSPNGSEIAFRSFRDGNYEIYSLDVDGGAYRRLTNTEAGVWNGLPAWSPDGARIAFETNRDGDWEIYVMDTNGGGLRNLTRHPADDHEPAWSPDGTELLFTSERDGNAELYILTLDTGDVRRLTYDCGADHNADWWPGTASASNALPRTAVGYVARSAPINLRAGPGLEYEVVGGAALNTCLTLVAQRGDWLQARHGGDLVWVARALLDLQGDLRRVPNAGD